MGFLAGKRVLIVGVASKLSIASGIAAAMHREGAELAFTYQNDKLKGRVEDFAAGWGSNAELCFPCDVASDSEITAVFDALSQKWDGLDIIVHSVGFAPGDQLAERADLMICNGGSLTVYQSLAAGQPGLGVAAHIQLWAIDVHLIEAPAPQRCRRQRHHHRR